MPIDFQKSTPLYVQIIEDIKSRIASGVLKEGEQLKSHKLLAEEYDVSLITIKGALSTLIDEGYLYSRVGKGTFVAAPPQVMQTTGINSIGLVLQDVKNPFFSQIAHTVEDTAYNKDYTVLLSNSANQANKEEGQIENFKRMGVKGMIIASLIKEAHAPEVVRSLHEQNFPYVMVSYTSDEDIWYVGSDHKKGAYMGTAHLISLGHAKIGYLNSPRENALGDVRQIGYRKALADYGLEFRSDYVLRTINDDVHKDYGSGVGLANMFHEMDDKPTAFFSYNDLSAIGFIRRVMELGYSVPDDVAIVGFDDIQQAEFAPVPLTTIKQDVERIGQLAIDKLIHRIEGDDEQLIHRTLITPTLVVRDSCGAKKAEVA
ncbi:MAG: GntR family transcriptional regulator [Bacteroidota bacterium]